MASHSKDHRNRPSRRSPSPHHRPRSRSRSPDHHPSSRRHRTPTTTTSRPSTRPHTSYSPSTSASVTKPLPFNAGPISKNAYVAYTPVFALYLDVQKSLVLEDLDEREARGRWKSFVNKWNRGELAEGWYDPVTTSKAKADVGVNVTAGGRRMMASPEYEARGYYDRRREHNHAREGNGDEDEDDDDFGPTLPQTDALRPLTNPQNPRSGPAIPSLEDIELQRESALEAHAESLSDLRFERRTDRKRQREQLDELVPRAEAGTRERQLEKKREKADANRDFARAKGSPGAEAEVGEHDLIGGDDGVDAYKRQKREMERKKNERELRREEVLRARAVEREERLREHQVKEDRTMDMLKALAKQRFG